MFVSVGGAHALILKDTSADSKHCLGNHRCYISSLCITMVTVPPVVCYVSFSHCQKMTSNTHTHTDIGSPTSLYFANVGLTSEVEPDQLMICSRTLDSQCWAVLLYLLMIPCVCFVSRPRVVHGVIRRAPGPAGTGCFRRRLPVW